MKKLFFFIALLLFSNGLLYSQVGINANNSAPDPSAGLDVNFNDKGLLLPRVALAAINSALPVTDPAVGLLVYNAVDDDSEASAGWYWQFNSKQGYAHDGANRLPDSDWISTIDESSDWQLSNDPCTLELGTGWRIPTSSEWTNVDESGNWADWNGPWNSALKIHVAGYLYGSDGSLTGRGSNGTYWSSTQDYSAYGWYLDFYYGGSNMYSNSKAFGFSVRCLRDF